MEIIYLKNENKSYIESFKSNSIKCGKCFGELNKKEIDD